MTEQQGNPRRSLALAIVLFIVAVAVFAVAFYLLDGYALVQEMTGGATVEAVDGPGNAATTTSQVSSDELTLPEGMSEEFALRLWQEQVESQASIERLLSDEFESFAFTGRTQDGDDVTLDFTASLRGGASADGRIGMHRYDDVWYFAWVSGLDTKAAGAPPSGPLPTLDDVDVSVINTMIAEQSKSSAATARYADGSLTELRVLETEEGPSTRSISVEMLAGEEMTEGDVIAIQSDEESGGKWFVARFNQGEE